MRGLIGFFNLTSWWQTALDERERTLICDRWTYIGLSGTGRYWYEEAEISSWPESAVRVVGGIANMFQKDGERHIAHKILEKAESMIGDETSILDTHFLYMSKIETTYRDSNIHECIDACYQQIGISRKTAAAFRAEYRGPLVEHTGYKRLAMIREHQGEFLECARVCHEALSEGWAGDWIERATRCAEREKKR
ncbi:MAG: hypothetical protein ACRD4I_09530 [Candidatus Angelobacter sp.]